MATKSIAARLARQFDANAADTKEMQTALRLQAKAWRIVACVSCDDQALGRFLSRNLFMATMPFVNLPAVEKLIEEYEPIAEISSVFDRAESHKGG